VKAAVVMEEVREGGMVAVEQVAGQGAGVKEAEETAVVALVTKAGAAVAETPVVDGLGVAAAKAAVDEARDLVDMSRSICFQPLPVRGEEGW
jgi:hypothetical protein